jgi:hypothetical protein
MGLPGQKIETSSYGLRQYQVHETSTTGVSPCRSRTGITQCLKLATPAEHPEPLALA